MKTLELEAALLGVTPNAVRLWKRGLRTPSRTAAQLRELLELCEVLAPNVYSAYCERVLDNENN